MSRLRLSVVIPAHNEAENLPVVLRELQQAFDNEAIPYEIIVVDDNSADDTEKVIDAISASDPRVRRIRRTPPKGFGWAVRAGLDHVWGDVVIVYMADQSDHPEDAVAYYRKIEQGYDCVFGSRFIKGASVQDYPSLKLIVNRIVNRFVQLMFWCRFNDLTNAFKAYRTDVIRDCGPYRSCHFNITIDMSLSALIRGYRIAQIPVRWTGRTWGMSNLRMVEMGRRYLATLVKVFAERLLVRDDLIADRNAERGTVPADRVSTDRPRPRREGPSKGGSTAGSTERDRTSGTFPHEGTID